MTQNFILLFVIFPFVVENGILVEKSKLKRLEKICFFCLDHTGGFNFLCPDVLSVCSFALIILVFRMIFKFFNIVFIFFVFLFFVSKWWTKLIRPFSLLMMKRLFSPSCSIPGVPGFSAYGSTVSRS
jgi:hypothetical protein